MLRILLEEVLGYEDVILVSDESGLDIEKSLTKLSKCGSYRYCILAMMYVPMIHKHNIIINGIFLKVLINNYALIVSYCKLVIKSCFLHLI